MSKKKHTEGHHGGAWKVAYADFVTAMMALFMVLWIVSQRKEVVQATADYFKNPIKPLASKFNSFITDKKKTKVAEDGEEKNIDLKELTRLAEEIYKNLQIRESDENKPIEIIVTDEGLKIFIYDLTTKPFFKENSSTLTDWGDFVLNTLAWILDPKPFDIAIDAYHPKIFKNFKEDEERLRQGYKEGAFTFWDLCISRAQLVYRSLIYYGFTLKKVEKVAGSLDLPKEIKHDTQVIEITLVLPK